MAVTPVAGEVLLALFNDKSAAIPPITFPGFNLTEKFSWSIWVYPLGQRGDPSIAITDITGTDGSRIAIGHNGFNWAYIIRAAEVAQDTVYFDDVIYNRWALFCFTKEGPNITMCYGVEDPATPGQPVVPRVILSTTSDQVFDFYYFLVRCGASYYTTNFKYWNDVLTLDQFQSQANRYDAGGSGPTPIWVSTLRTPGDISSIVNPRIGTSWDAGHAFSFTSSPDSLKYVNNDPSYLITTPCPTWIYPINPDAVSSYNPGTAPLVPTNYDAPQFWQMQDRGSLPAADSTLQSIEYYAYPNAYGSGIQASDSWGLYKDERGARVVSDHANPANRLETDTGVAIPPGSINPIKISTMYAWQFGAQFTWMAGTGPTAQQKINYLHLFVSYIGSPTGVPGLPIDIPGISVQKLTGLFAVSKGSHTDKYNLDAELKIPQPTIRTAYIGK